MKHKKQQFPLSPPGSPHSSCLLSSPTDTRCLGCRRGGAWASADAGSLWPAEPARRSPWSGCTAPCASSPRGARTLPSTLPTPRPTTCGHTWSRERRSPKTPSTHIHVCVHFFQFNPEKRSQAQKCRLWSQDVKQISEKSVGRRDSNDLFLESRAL